MAEYWLREKMSELILLDLSAASDTVDLRIIPVGDWVGVFLSLLAAISLKVWNLGILIGSDLTFTNHIRTPPKEPSIILKNIVNSVGVLPRREKLICAFISSRVDYCTGLLTGLPKKTVKQLHLIESFKQGQENRAHYCSAKIITLASSYRADFKALLLVYESLNDFFWYV